MGKRRESPGYRYCCGYRGVVLGDHRPTAERRGADRFGNKRRGNCRRRRLQVVSAQETCAFYGDFALFECAALCLATGVLFTSLIGIAEHIWLVWLTLPVLAPLIFGIRFYGVFGAAWFPYFVNVPIVCLIIFEVTVLFVPEAFGAWLCFLFIPLYYAAAATWTVVLLRRRKAQGAK